MSSHRPSEAELAEGYPAYSQGHAEELYIDGYEPVSLGAQHSSLMTTSTWLGMSLIMASLAGFGILLWALAQNIWGTGSVDHDPMMFIIIGAVLGIGMLATAFVLIAIGRKNYKEYTRRSGRLQ